MFVCVMVYAQQQNEVYIFKSGDDSIPEYWSSSGIVNPSAKIDVWVGLNMDTYLPESIIWEWDKSNESGWMGWALSSNIPSDFSPYIEEYDLVIKVRGIMINSNSLEIVFNSQRNNIRSKKLEINDYMTDTSLDILYSEDINTTVEIKIPLERFEMQKYQVATIIKEMQLDVPYAKCLSSGTLYIENIFLSRRSR
jgi:hypothetical protein